LKYIEEFIVLKSENKIRLSDLDITYFKTIFSKKSLKKAIKNKRIFINQQLGYSGNFLIGGETIGVRENQNIKTKPIYKLKIQVIFEDDFMAIVTKPAGLSTSGNQFKNLENCLPFNLKKSEQNDALIKPLVIHRLDFATSGIVLVGKTKTATINLNKQFESRKVNKQYLAVNLNTMKSPININRLIDGKEALSICTVLKTLQSEKYDCINLVQIKPISGRRHQIRKHLASIGHPICGDNLYNHNIIDIKGNGLYLHAYKISFLHPQTRNLVSFEAEMPKKFKRLFHKL